MFLVLKRGILNPSAWMLMFAAIATLVTFYDPTIELEQNTYNYVVIFDITQSMNTHDYKVDGMPPDRLSFAKKTLRNTLQDIPCGSQIGLGIFSNKEILLLFNPIEVCKNFSILDDVIAHIDWRMTWAAQSNIRRGLYNSLRTLSRLPEKPHIVFMTDGESTVQDFRPAPFHRLSKKIKGMIIGVGGHIPTPIPKLDQENTLMGYWKKEEISILHHTPDESGSDTGYYLSTVDQTHLQNLATLTGLHYYHLETIEHFKQALFVDEFATKRRVNDDIRWVFGLLAMTLVLATYLPNLLVRKNLPNNDG